MTKSSEKMHQLVKSGNNLLSKGRLTEALTKFQTAQKDDPNNALINSSVSKINAQIKAQKNSKTTFERYTGATPATISELERNLKKIQDDLEKEEKKLKFCRINVKNKIKEIRSLDQQYAEVYGEKNTLENELKTVNKELNRDKDNMSNIMNRIKKVLQRRHNLSQKKNTNITGGKKKRTKKSKRSKRKRRK